MTNSTSWNYLKLFSLIICSLLFVGDVSAQTSGNLDSQTANSSCTSPDGSATITASGGTAPYSFSWGMSGNNPSVTDTYTITGLADGTHIITVSDMSNTDFVTVTIAYTGPAQPTIALTMTPESCTGSNGTATATGSGGTAPYTYVWDASMTTQTLTGLTTASHYAVVTDNNGCTDSLTISVTSNIGQPASNVAVVDNSSNCIPNGTATAAPSGGSTPYTYLWSNGATTASLTGLDASSVSGLTVTDATACSSDTSIMITDTGGGSPASIMLSPSNPASCGSNDGTVTTSVSSGQSPFTYLWSNAETSADISSLPAGTYTLTFTDACATSDIQSVTLTSGGAGLSTSLSQTDPSSCGATDGSATVSISTGDSPYTYAWSIAGTTDTQTGLAAGSVSVTVTDACGATEMQTVTLTETPAGLSTSLSQTDPSTCGGSDGQAVVSISTGDAPYTYNWSVAGSTDTQTGLSAGVISVTVTDACLGESIQSVTLTDPGASLSTSSSFTDPTTCGGADGTVSVSISTGESPYTYAWSNGPSTDSQSNLAAGTYSVTVGDNCGGSSVQSLTLTDPGASLSTSSSFTDPTSCGGTDGTVAVSISSGESPYTFAWSNGASTDSQSSLVAGTYSVTVTDNCAGSSVQSVTLTNTPTGLSISTSGSDPTSCGATDGSATVSITSGDSPYTYAWSNGGNTDNLAAVGAGTYTVTVTDNCSQEATSSYTVNAAGGGSVSISVTSANPSACGVSDGSASVSVLAGTTPYTYLWSNGAMTTSVTGLGAGSYGISVTDGCGNVTATPVTMTAPGGVSMTVAVTTTEVSSCGGSDGTATAVITGGTAPFAYSWSTLETSATASALSVSSYNVTVTDNCGTVASAAGTVSLAAAGNLTISETIVNTTDCSSPDGSIALVTSGGQTPYSYSWSVNTASLTETASNLMPDFYLVTVTDNCGIQGTGSYNVTGPAAVSVSLSATDDLCNQSNGTTTATVSGGQSPYTYGWTSGGMNATVTGLTAGTYSITLTDACLTEATGSVVVNATGSSVTVAITEDAAPSCGQSNGGLTSAANNGSAPYTYAWSNFGSTAVITSLAAGSYSVTTTDNNGCTATASHSLVNPGGASVSVDNVTADDCTTSNGTVDVSATGGTTPYVYSWSNGGASASLTGLAAGTYVVTVTDNAGCIDITTVSVTANGTAATINGVITASSVTTTAATVYLLHDDGSGLMDTVQTTTPGINGDYSFDNLTTEGNYIVVADPDTNTLFGAIPTYDGNTAAWDSAMVINLSCSNTYTADIDIIVFNALNGTGTIAGTILSDVTGKNMSGDPIDDVDILLSRDPGGIIASDVTDANGDFEFTNVPVGTFKVLVNIPGADQVESYNIEIVDDEEVSDVDFLVGDTTIYISTGPDAVVVPVTEDLSYSIYPNPFTNNFNITLSNNTLNTTIQVLDMTGKIIYNDNTNQDTHQIDLSGFEGGIYFIKIMNDERDHVTRLVKQ